LPDGIEEFVIGKAGQPDAKEVGLPGSEGGS
jgi:hypothetical protein